MYREQRCKTKQDKLMIFLCFFALPFLPSLILIPYVALKLNKKHPIREFTLILGGKYNDV